MSNPKGFPRWKKGQSGNPNGRPRKPERQILLEAMAEKESERGKSLWLHLVERAYEDDTVLIALAKKFVPDLSHDVGMAEVMRTFLVRADTNSKLSYTKTIEADVVDDAAGQ